MSAPIKVGSRVTRDTCGLSMGLYVTKVENDVIHCGPWKFCAKTGAEIDEEIGWGPPPLHTGSYLQELCVEAQN